MITIPRPRDTSQTAVLIRVAAMLLALASIIVIPLEIIAVGTGQASLQGAVTTSAILATLTLLVIRAARSLDPLRA